MIKFPTVASATPRVAIARGPRLSCRQDQSSVNAVSSWKPTLNTTFRSSAVSRSAFLNLSANEPTPRMTPPDDVEMTRNAKQYTNSRLVAAGRGRDASTCCCAPTPGRWSLRAGVAIIGAVGAVAAQEEVDVTADVAAASR